MSRASSRRPFVALALSLCFTAGAFAGPAIADFASQADSIYPSLSPDGQKIAFVTRVEGNRMLMVIDLEKRERRGLMNAITDSFEISYCQFKNDERLLCGFRGTEFFRGQPYTVSRLVAVDVSGKAKPRVLIQNGTEGGSQFQDQVLDWQRDDPKRVLIQLSGDGDPFPTVHSLDVYTGLTYVVQRSRSAILDWTPDRKGAVRFGYGFDGRKHSYIARDSSDAPWRTLAKWEIGESDFSVVGFGVTPATLLVEASHNGRNAIFEMDLERAERSPVVVLQSGRGRRWSHLLAGRQPHHRLRVRNRPHVPQVFRRGGGSDLRRHRRPEAGLRQLGGRAPALRASKSRARGSGQRSRRSPLVQSSRVHRISAGRVGDHGFRISRIRCDSKTRATAAYTVLHGAAVRRGSHRR